MSRAYRRVIKDFLYPADVLDFLLRDAHFCGTLEYGSIDWFRLIRSSHIFGDEIIGEERMVEALNSYIYNKVKMYECVYYHRTCRIVDLILRDIMQKVDRPLGLTDRVLRCLDGDIKGFLELDDYSLLKMILETQTSTIDGKYRNDFENAKANVELLLRRELPLGYLTKGYRDFTHEELASYLDACALLPSYIEKIENLFLTLAKESAKLSEIVNELKCVVDCPQFKYFPTGLYTDMEKIRYRLIKDGKPADWNISQFFKEFPTLFRIEYRIYIMPKKFTPKHDPIHGEEIKRIGDESLNRILHPSVPPVPTM